MKIILNNLKKDQLQYDTYRVMNASTISRLDLRGLTRMGYLSYIFFYRKMTMCLPDQEFSMMGRSARYSCRYYVDLPIREGPGIAVSFSQIYHHRHLMPPSLWSNGAAKEHIESPAESPTVISSGFRILKVCEYMYELRGN